MYLCNAKSLPSVHCYVCTAYEQETSCLYDLNLATGCCYLWLP